MAKIPDVSDKVIVIISVVGIVSLLLGSLLSAQTKSFPENLASEDTYVATEDEMPPPAGARENTLFDLENATRERILGNAFAPIKISEHASLTCSHCAHFHKDVFEKFKAAYVDTGKAYIVFSDFPLNKPALDASKIARCVPEDRYFDFIGMLFDTQGDWAFDENYKAMLKSKAADFGLNEETFENCLNSEALENAIIAQIKASQSQWNINSTPTFVINNRKLITGAGTYEAFAKAVDDSVAELKTEEKEMDSGETDMTAPPPPLEDTGDAGKE